MLHFVVWSLANRAPLRMMEGEDVRLGSLDDYDEVRRAARILEKAASMRPLALVGSELAMNLVKVPYVVVDAKDVKRLEYLDAKCISRGHATGPNVAYVIGQRKKMSQSREKFLAKKKEPKRLARWPSDDDVAGFIVDDDVEGAIEYQKAHPHLLLLLPFDAPLVDNALYLFDLDKTHLDVDDDEDEFIDDEDDEFIDGEFIDDEDDEFIDDEDEDDIARTLRDLDDQYRRSLAK